MQCNRWPRPACDKNVNPSIGSCCSNTEQYFSSTTSCTLRAKSDDNGNIAIVYSPPGIEFFQAFSQRVQNETKTFFRVDWTRRCKLFCHNMSDDYCVCDVNVWMSRCSIKVMQSTRTLCQVLCLLMHLNHLCISYRKLQQMAHTIYLIYSHFYLPEHKPSWRVAQASLAASEGQVMTGPRTIDFMKTFFRVDWTGEISFSVTTFQQHVTLVMHHPKVQQLCQRLRVLYQLQWL